MAQVKQRTSTQAGGICGICPLQELTEETVNISEYRDFGFFDHVSYKDNSELGATSIGRWLGVSYRVGGLMSYCILTQKATVISHTMMQCATGLKKQMDEFKLALNEFDSESSLRFKKDKDPEDRSQYLEYDPDNQEEFNWIIDGSNIPEMSLTRNSKGL